MADIFSPSIIVTAALVSLLAELGDKSQIVILTLASRSRSVIPVFSGAYLAEMMMNGLGITAGTLTSFVIPPGLLGVLSGLIFIAFGVVSIFHRETIKEAGSGKARDSVGFWPAFSLIAVAELGDKTQVAGVALAMEFDSPFSIFLGFAIALLGMSAASALVGERISRVLPLRLVRIGSGLVFIAFGVVSILGSGSLDFRVM